MSIVSTVKGWFKRPAPPAQEPEPVEPTLDPWEDSADFDDRAWCHDPDMGDR